MIADAGDGDVTGGTQGFEALSLARQAWSQAAKMGDVERILNRAALTDNPATSIKSGIRVLLNSRAARGYSDAEIQALKDAASRGVIGGALHVFGSRLTPLIAGGIGATGGPFGAIATAGITHALGSGARALATNIQEGRAQNALSVLGSGVPPAVAQAIREAEPIAKAPAAAASPELPIATPIQREQANIATMTNLRDAVTAGTIGPTDPAISRILSAVYGGSVPEGMSRPKLTNLLTNFINRMQAQHDLLASQDAAQGAQNYGR
jgi:hypothetical protein